MTELLNLFRKVAVRTSAMGTLSACIMALTSCAGRSLPTHPQREQADERPRLRFTCEEDAPRVTSSLQRLSKTQYENALGDLLNALMPPHHMQGIWDEVATHLAFVPRDTISKHAPFSTMDQAISQQHAEVYFRIAHTAARALTDSKARLDALLGCEDGASDNGCVDAFLQRLARHAYRRPVTDADMNYLHGVYYAQGIDVDGLRDVIEAVMTSPFFLYRVEFGERAVPGKKGVYALSNHELASKLSFTFWQTQPDYELMQAADRGELTTDEGYARQLDRVLAHDRATLGLQTFVSEWLGLEGLREMNSLVGDPLFDAFRGETEVEHDLREAMIDDVIDSFVYHVQRDDGYADFFSSPYSFARNDGLAKIYGVETWNGKTDPPRFPEGQRAGLLTRAALVASGTANTRPIMKGVFVRERLLCDRLPAPPANAASGLLELSPTATTREIVEGLTEQGDSSCAFCHASRINALGFATENYDALGRVRTEQTLFSADGKTVGKRSINTAAVPHIWPGDDRVAAGVDELAEMIRSSGKGERCFALQFSRFALGRSPEESTDGCMLEELRAALAGGVGLRQAMRLFAMRPEFRQRSVGVVQ